MAKNQKSKKSKDSVQDPLGKGLDMNNPFDRDEYSSQVAINTLKNHRS